MIEAGIGQASPREITSSTAAGHRKRKWDAGRHFGAVAGTSAWLSFQIAGRGCPQSLGDPGFSHTAGKEVPGPVTRPTLGSPDPLGTPFRLRPACVLTLRLACPLLAVSYQLPEPRDNELGSLTPSSIPGLLHPKIDLLPFLRSYTCRSILYSLFLFLSHNLFLFFPIYHLAPLFQLLAICFVSVSASLSLLMFLTFPSQKRVPST